MFKPPTSFGFNNCFISTVRASRPSESPPRPCSLWRRSCRSVAQGRWPGALQLAVSVGYPKKHEKSHGFPWYPIVHNHFHHQNGLFHLGIFHFCTPNRRSWWWQTPAPERCQHQPKGIDLRLQNNQSTRSTKVLWFFSWAIVSCHMKPGSARTHNFCPTPVLAFGIAHLEDNSRLY